MSSALLQIETEIKQRLESIPFFAPFTILVEPRKNIVAEIESSIGKLKTLIAPKVVGADDMHPNVNGVYFDSIRISVGVFQNPILRGDHADVFEICEEIHKALKWWTPDSLVNAINPAKPGIEPIADKKLNIMSCNFETKGGFIGALATTADPVITPDDNTDLITITCATPGAVIFYTFDGSKPTPQSNLYLAPIPPQSEDISMKARAFMPGKLASKVVSSNFVFNL